LFLLR
jgi:hypothetical protein